MTTFNTLYHRLTVDATEAGNVRVIVHLRDTRDERFGIVLDVDDTVKLAAALNDTVNSMRAAKLAAPLNGTVNSDVAEPAEAAPPTIAERIAAYDVAATHLRAVGGYGNLDDEVAFILYGNRAAR